jgi:hypothetical protein
VAASASTVISISRYRQFAILRIRYIRLSQNYKRRRTGRPAIAAAGGSSWRGTMREIAPREREKFHHAQKRQIPREKRCLQPGLVVPIPPLFDLSKQIKVEGREAYSLSSRRAKSED